MYPEPNRDPKRQQARRIPFQPGAPAPQPARPQEGQQGPQPPAQPARAPEPAPKTPRVPKQPGAPDDSKDAPRPTRSPLRMPERQPGGTAQPPRGKSPERAPNDEPEEPQAALPAMPAGRPDHQPAKPKAAPGKKPSAPQATGELREIEVDASIARTLTATTSSPRHKVEAWLAVMTKEGASDLILRAGGRPSLRVNGKISFLPGRVPAAGPLLEVLEAVMGEKRMEVWRETGSADAGLHFDGLGRFRLNAYKQIGEPAVVIRRINEEAPSINGLNLPAEELKRLALKKRGLILVTGIAGSGKSTTLAAMIEFMNQTLERHVVTLEDPVELLFTENRCVISQREVGTDCSSFQDGLRHALRQSPDTILIGEMRDAETVNAALDATETGHLVLSTLHTVNAPQTVERILSFFPAEQHKQVRGRLADNVAGVLSQRLVPACDGLSLIPAFELMLSTPHIRDLLALGDTGEIARVVDSGSEKGVVSFNQCLRQLVLRQLIDLEDAMAASDRPEELVLALRGITGSNAKIDPTAVRRQQDAGGNDGLRMA